MFCVVGGQGAVWSLLARRQNNLLPSEFSLTLQRLVVGSKIVFDFKLERLQRLLSDPAEHWPQQMYQRATKEGSCRLGNQLRQSRAPFRWIKTVFGDEVDGMGYGCRLA